MRKIDYIKFGVICAVFFGLYWYIGSLMYDDAGFRIEYILGTLAFGVLMFFIDLIGRGFRKK